MDIQQARTFLEIVGTGSFQLAAERLYVTQSAVSLRVKRMEADLGQTLFTRSKAGAVMTPAGEQFARFARSLVRVWEEARHQVAVPDGFDDTLILGAQPSLWPGLGPALAAPAGTPAAAHGLPLRGGAGGFADAADERRRVRSRRALHAAGAAGRDGGAADRRPARARRDRPGFRRHRRSALRLHGLVIGVHLRPQDALSRAALAPAPPCRSAPSGSTT